MTSKTLFTITILLLSLSVQAQFTFKWEQSGFEPGTDGGTYTNVGGSGIDLTISGLVNTDFFPAYYSVSTGINNMEANQLTHLYTFTFSEPVSVSFEIDNINSDFEWECYNDRLLFSDNPSIQNDHDVHVNGNTVVPLDQGDIPGHVKVKYYKVTEFTIKHGSGQSCNPGYIIIGPLSIGREIYNIPLNPYSTFVQQELEFNFDQKIMKADVYDCLGRLVDADKQIDEQDIIFDFKPVANAYYFIRVLLENGEYFTEEILVCH